MVEKWLAGVGLALCALYALAMVLGEKRRARVRALLQRVARWPRSRRDARREAQRAIERARRNVVREGNVLRPKSFERRPPDEPLH